MFESTLPVGVPDLMRVSAFRRWCRNCPKHVHLAYSDGQLHVLGEDTAGQVKDDEAHRLSSMKVPWVVKS